MVLQDRVRARLRYEWTRATESRAFVTGIGRVAAHSPLATPRLKVYGLPRSGTNYVQQLLERNFRLRSLGSEGGGAWKHGPVSTSSIVPAVVVTKHPYTWLRSLRRWEIAHGRCAEATSMLEFLDRPVTLPKLSAAWGAERPAAIWNAAVRHWDERCDAAPNVAVVGYEAVVDDLVGSLGYVQDALGLTPRGVFRDIEGRADVWATPGPRAELDRTSFDLAAAVGAVDTATRAAASRLFDAELAAAHGYEL